MTRHDIIFDIGQEIPYEVFKREIAQRLRPADIAADMVAKLRLGSLKAASAVEIPCRILTIEQRRDHEYLLDAALQSDWTIDLRVFWLNETGFLRADNPLRGSVELFGYLLAIDWDEELQAIQATQAVPA